VASRPLSLVRCPLGHQRKCFFQKHVTETVDPRAIVGVPVVEKAGSAPAIYVAIRDLRGLITLVQMGVLEIHPWGSRAAMWIDPTR